MAEIILSIIAIVVSIFSFLFSIVQNRRLHNDNKRLQVLPVISQKLMVWARIKCKIEKRNNGIDKLNILVSPYDTFYNNNDIFISKSEFPLLTLLSKNSGNGMGDNVCVKELTILTTTDKLDYTLDKKLFSCPAGETIATRIYANIKAEAVKEVTIKIRYTDIFGKPYLSTSTFAMQEFPFAEMRLINTCREVEHS